MEGVKIRAIGQYLLSDPAQARITLTVNPVPAGDMETELGQYLIAAARSWLIEKGLVTEDYTDLTAQGPMQ